jgi:hypothetical protein
MSVDQPRTWFVMHARIEIVVRKHVVVIVISVNLEKSESDSTQLNTSMSFKIDPGSLPKYELAPA